MSQPPRENTPPPPADDPRPDAVKRPQSSDGVGDTRKTDENSQHKGGASGTGGVGGTGGSVL